LEIAPVICPSCFEEFHVPLPPLAEVPCEVDYDCEICCRPMLIDFDIEGDDVTASARSIHD